MRRSVAGLAARAGGSAALLALAGCGSNLGAPEPASEQGRTVLDMWRVLFWLSAAVGGTVLVLAAIAIVRGRRGDRDELPAQSHGSALLEGVYIAIPLGIVAGLFVYTLRTDEIVNDEVADPDVVVEVTGYRWGWRFEYPDHGVLVESIAGETPEMVLPVDADVRIELASSDVIHSFYVPSFLTKRDLIPGLRSHLDVRTTRVAELHGHCAEYCGLDHSRMDFTVRIVEADEFDAWADETARESTR